LSEISGIDPRRHARATIVGIIIAGGVLIAGLWGAAVASIVAASNTAMNHAQIEGHNLAAAFADEVVHTLNGVTAGMEVVARRMRSGPPPFPIHDWAREIPVLSFATIQGALIGPDGRLISTTLDPNPKPIDLSDREHFRVHLDGRHKGVFIGKPVVGRVSGQTTIQVTRRVDANDGKFLGVIVFSLSPASLTNLNTSIDLGPRGSLALVGLDNVVRARFTRDRTDGLDGIGQTVRGAANGAAIPRDGHASVIRTSVIDNVERLFSYRRAGDYPVVVWVGLGLNEVLAPARQDLWVVGAIAVAATIIPIGVGGFLIRDLRRRAGDEIALMEERSKLEASNRQLQDAQATLRDAVDSIPEAFSIFDSADRFVTCNEAFRRLFPGDAAVLTPEVTFEQLTRKAAASGLFLAAVGRETEWVGERLEAHRSPGDAIEQPLADGRWLLITERKMRNGGTAGLRIDITRLKETEARLRRTMEDLGRIQQIAGLGSMDVDIPSDHIAWSPGAAAIFGVDADQVEPTREYLLSFVHQDDRARVGEAAADSRRRGVAAPPLEYRIVRPDGGVRVVYRENDIQLDPRGRPTRRIMTFKDITELKATEMRLRRAMENLERAQRLSHTGSVLRYPDGSNAEWSDETYRIFGVDPKDDEPTLDNLLKMMAPEDRAKLLAAEEELARGQTPAPFEYRIRRPDGEICWIQRITEIVRDDDGTAVQIAATIRDITEVREGEERQRALERQLLHSQKLEAVGTLAGGIAHELNNALVPIFALGPMVLDSLPPNDTELREDMEMILEASQRAQGLVRGILAFSRKEAEEAKTEIDPGDLVRRTLSMLRVTLPATMQINQDVAPVPPILGDAAALQQVIVNLVTNAAHAMGSAVGSVTVRIDTAAPEHVPPSQIGNEFVRLRVADTGCGMDGPTMRRVFEPFFTTKGVGEGTGLGLSVAHGIIADHGGQIDVHSEAGNGTEFTIYLPSSQVSTAVSGIAA
jgi:PAS domain S-box-containing protein